jgi:hypothetical protein
MRANAWRFKLSEPELPLPERFLPTGTRPGPEHADVPAPFPSTQPVGFHTAIEYRFVSGSFTEPGPAVCWIRIKYPIVAGTDPSPLERTLAAADSGNGVSAVMDWSKYLFINTDLTVTLHRQPAGEWVCLDAAARKPSSSATDSRGRPTRRSSPRRSRTGRHLLNRSTFLVGSMQNPTPLISPSICGAAAVSVSPGWQS